MRHHCIFTVGRDAAVAVAFLALAGCALDTAGALGDLRGPDGGSTHVEASPTLDASGSDALRSDARSAHADANEHAHDASRPDGSLSDASRPDASASDGGLPPVLDGGADVGHGMDAGLDARLDAPHDSEADHTEMSMKDASDGAPSCSSSCGGSCPPCTIGEACSLATECASSYCSNSQCAYAASCEAIYAGDSALPTGAYTLEAGGSTFGVSCYMGQGGGWTLIAKMGSTASPGTFAYNATYWTQSNTLNPTSTDFSQNEAKLQSFNVLPFQNVLAVMTPLGGGTVNSLVVPVADSTSFLHMMNSSSPPSTSLGASAWKALSVPAAVIQGNCNAEGVDQQPSGGGAQGDTAHVRLGLLGNDGNDGCKTPDSYVGFGGSYSAGSCQGVSYSAGVMGGGDCSGGPNVADFGYLYVR